MTDARHLKWSELATDRPMPLIERQRVIADEMMISRVRLGAGFELASHHHANEQIVVVLSGRCRFTLGAEGDPACRTVEIVGGDVLVLPSDVPHSCTALEETLILDLFSPPSEKTGVDRA